MNRIDLNLLYIAESLYRTHNVSQTANELSLTQSAISHGLSRLRNQFDDVLFVRSSKGVKPTRRALELRQPIIQLIEQSKKLIESDEPFDPSKIKARIQIATTDYLEILLIPKLINKLSQIAPGIQISIRPTGGDLPKYQLENGLCDLAIAGFYKALPEGFYQTNLFTDEFAMAHRQKHPAFNRKLNLKDYFNLEHALITLQGDFKDNLAKKIGQQELNRSFKYGSYSFTGIAWTIAQSDLVLTAPKKLLTEYEKYFPIEIKELPFAIPPIHLKIVWHSITHKDPLYRWFREILKQLIE